MKTNTLLKKIISIIFFMTLLGSCSSGGTNSNVAPFADAGVDQVVTLKTALIPLDGRASRDDDGDDLSFRWELTSKPPGSSAVLTNISTSTPSLSVVDFAGVYSLSLIVNDGMNDSVADTAIITAVQNAKNIILLIGDGMGYEQVRAAGMYANGTAGTLPFERFLFQGSVSTSNASDELTDSAAAATAMATGFKVDNGVISQQIPGDASDLETILETAKRLGASAGLVTTTIISHATPAAFGAHEPSRNNFHEIIADYLANSQPNVLLGGAQFVDPVSAENAGYTVVEDYDSLIALNTDYENKIWGQFGETQMPYEWDGVGIFPHLSESAETALAILDNYQNGFFLMVEGGRIDHAGHVNDLQRNIFETVEFANTAKMVMNWAENRVDTLVIVTADHETGGLQIIANNGQGNFPEVTWSTLEHTDIKVPIFTWGVNAHLLKGSVENTDIYRVMRSALTGN